MTSHVSPEDFQLGYSMTGLVERSSSKYVNFQTTHLAFVRRSQQHHPFLGDQEQDANKKNNFNKHFLTNLEFTKILSNHHHHSLDNHSYQSAQKLKRNLQTQRCDSTSSDSSTSTLVEEGFRYDDVTADTSQKEMFNKDQDVILVVSPKVSSFVEKCEKQNNTFSSHTKCCSVQCIDSMSTVSSVCPLPCPTNPVYNCFKKSPKLPKLKKEIHSLTTTISKKHEKEEKVYADF